MLFPPAPTGAGGHEPGPAVRPGRLAPRPRPHRRTRRPPRVPRQADGRGRRWMRLRAPRTARQQGLNHYSSDNHLFHFLLTTFKLGFDVSWSDSGTTLCKMNKSNKGAYSLQNSCCITHEEKNYYRVRVEVDQFSLLTSQGICGGARGGDGGRRVRMLRDRHRRRGRALRG